MAAVEMFSNEATNQRPARPDLRIVSTSTAATFRHGPSVAQRRAARARMKARRRRTALVAAVVASLVVLSWPGHAFGRTNGVGLSNDVASTSGWSSGMIYVVQPGDTVSSIAAMLNPVDPSQAEIALGRELRSTVVVTGEHVLIP